MCYTFTVTVTSCNLLLLDGMDQNKTNVPSLRKLAKSTQSLWRLRTHLTGVLVHTKCEKGKKAYAFLDVLQYPHDANLVLTILMLILKDYEHSNWPSTLFLQMDNCYRENKNRYVFAFCLKGIFKEVCLENFLLTYSLMAFYCWLLSLGLC